MIEHHGGVASMTEASANFDKSTLSRIFPYVVPRTWVEYAGRQAIVEFPFSDEVRLILVVDGQGTVRNVRPSDLEAIGTSIEDAFDIAANNLGAAWQAQQFSFGIAELVDGTLIGGARGNWMAPAGALVLGNFYQMLRDQFDQDEFAAVAVNQETLFAFPADDKTIASASLRQAIDDEFTQHRKPISRSWLLLDGNWPREHPWQDF
jgi:hypothetical protein